MEKILLGGDMEKIVICKTCERPEYWEEMRWLNGKCQCRSCYKFDYEQYHHSPYKWNDLDGPRPSIEDYKKQNN